MESQGQKTSNNPKAMLSSIMSKRQKLQDELRTIEKQVYELEASYLQESSNFGNVWKGYEWFLSSSKNTPNSSDFRMLLRTIATFLGLAYERLASYITFFGPSYLTLFYELIIPCETQKNMQEQKVLTKNCQVQNKDIISCERLVQVSAVGKVVVGGCYEVDIGGEMGLTMEFNSIILHL